MAATALDRTSFDAGRHWCLSPQVALREESFGALAYHYGTRRLVFLKSPLLVEVVAALGAHRSADDALAALVEPAQRAPFRRALGRLAASQVIDAC